MSDFAHQIYIQKKRNLDEWCEKTGKSPTFEMLDELSYWLGIVRERDKAAMDWAKPGDHDRSWEALEKLMKEMCGD